MSYALGDDLYEEYRQRRKLRANLEELQQQVKALQDNISVLLEVNRALVRALAFGETTFPNEYQHVHGLCGQETGPHLAEAARLLAMDLEDLGLDYYICPHGENPTLCNECRGIFDEPPYPHDQYDEPSDMLPMEEIDPAEYEDA